MVRSHNRARRPAGYERVISGALLQHEYTPISAANATCLTLTVSVVGRIVARTRPGGAMYETLRSCIAGALVASNSGAATTKSLAKRRLSRSGQRFHHSELGLTTLGLGRPRSSRG